MNRPVRITLCAALLLAAGSAVAQTPVDTGWTYQGRLTDNAIPANGPYDLKFTLFMDDQGTLQNGATLDMPGIQVDAGLFTTKLDFGALFTGSKNWLQVEVSPPGAGTYTALPLQEITSAPQSLFAQVLGLPYAGSGSVASPDAAFKVTNPGTGFGLWGQSDGVGGYGVRGTASAVSGINYGVVGETSSTSGTGVVGAANATSGGIYGVFGGCNSNAGVGVKGTVFATASGTNSGVNGESFSTTGVGVYGIASSSTGFNFGGDFVTNSPDGRGIRANANATTGLAVGGRFASASNGGIGVWSTASAASGATYGVYGDSASTSGTGVYGSGSVGVRGQSATGSTFSFGVSGTSTSDSGSGVRGECNTGSLAYGVWGLSSTGYAGFFQGNARVTGNLSVFGNISKAGGSFKIDHPLDPANKYLSHSFVESPDMKNIYDGNVQLDQRGAAEVVMPEWFDALNTDFRYQLTALGEPGPNLYIAQTMKNGHFVIAGGSPGGAVSWQVTGIRQDAWANAHRIPVEETKQPEERGLFLHPELYGQPPSASIDSLKGTGS